MLGGREDLHCLNGASGTDSAGHRISPKTVASPGTYQGTGRRPGAAPGQSSLVHWQPSTQRHLWRGSTRRIPASASPGRPTVRADAARFALNLR